jgi:hypothetical protein
MKAEKDKIRQIIKNYVGDSYYPWEEGPGIEYQDEQGNWHWLKAKKDGSRIEVVGLEGVHVFHFTEFFKRA